MSSEADVKFEIGHVLFIDIVGYSKLLIHEQTEQLQKLWEIARATNQFRAAEGEGKLLRLPTGDGGALVFRDNPEATVGCLLEISKALKNYHDLRVRMGVHSGPVREVMDLNEQANIAGAGINMAQRVMDCGDAGHILLSKRVADDLEQYGRWRPLLHDLGICEVKHGATLGIVNLYSDEIGNPEVPEKIKGGEIPREKPSAPIPRKSIAVLPFENLSEDKANAYFADGIQEEILATLSRIGDLKVISRTSTLRFKNAPDSISAIAKQLGVANIISRQLNWIRTTRWPMRDLPIFTASHLDSDYCHPKRNGQKRRKTMRRKRWNSTRRLVKPTTLWRATNSMSIAIGQVRNGIFVAVWS